MLCVPSYALRASNGACSLVEAKQVIVERSISELLFLNSLINIMLGGFMALVECSSLSL